jgi:hypothetical protein
MDGRESIGLIEIETGTSRPLMSDPRLSCYFGTATGADRLGFITGGFDQPWTLWSCDWQGGKRVRLGPCDEIAPCGTVDGILLWAYRDKVYSYDGGQPRLILSLSAVETVTGLTAEPVGHRVLITTRDASTGVPTARSYVWSPTTPAYRLVGVSGLRWLCGGYLLGAGGTLLDVSGGTPKPRVVTKAEGYWRRGAPAPVPWPLFD